MNVYLKNLTVLLLPPLSPRLMSAYRPLVEFLETIKKLEEERVKFLEKLAD